MRTIRQPLLRKRLGLQGHLHLYRLVIPRDEASPEVRPVNLRNSRSRMNIARIVVLTIALGAGGVAAYLASGIDSKPPAPAAPVAQLETVDVLVAKSDIGLGQTLTSNDMIWQSWPASTTSGSFIRRNDRPDATNQIAGSIA